jgi:hypothetical protein
VRFYEGVGLRVLKIEQPELEVLCTYSTALLITTEDTYQTSQLCANTYNKNP